VGINLADKTERSTLIAIIVLIGVVVVAEYAIAHLDLVVLKLLLTPATILISILTNIDFFWKDGVGYVNETATIIIDRGCVGTTIFLLSFGIGASSVLLKSKGIAIKQIAGILFTSYLLTIFANVSRIVITIQLLQILPHVVSNKSIHTALGVFIFFTFLIIYKYFIDLLFNRKGSYEPAS